MSNYYKGEKMVFLYQIFKGKTKNLTPQENREWVTLKTPTIHEGDNVMMKMKTSEGYKYITGEFLRTTIGGDGWVDRIHLKDGREIDAKECFDIIKLVPEKTEFSFKNKYGLKERKAIFLEFGMIQLTEPPYNEVPYLGYVSEKKKLQMLSPVQTAVYVPDIIDFNVKEEDSFYRKVRRKMYRGE